jgi:hypothetical protein
MAGRRRSEGAPPDNPSEAPIFLRLQTPPSGTFNRSSRRIGPIGAIHTLAASLHTKHQIRSTGTSITCSRT